LIDECLPIQVRNFFDSHEAVTVAHMGWRSMPDPDLLIAAERNGFDIFLTADAGIPYSHDLAGWHLAVVAVPTNRRKVLEGMSKVLENAVEGARPGEFHIVQVS